MAIAPFGAKAARFIRRPVEQDATLNILNGAVRSSKTWAINAKLLTLLSTGWWPGGTGLITGASKISIKTNVLNDLFNWVGERRYRYNSQTGELKLMGRPFLVCGAKDEASHKAIKGSTVGVWIADEMTLYPQSFFDMAMTRLSLRGARAYGSTNPADPYHYLKADWIDNEKKIADGDVWSDTFTLLDNPNIEESKKQQLIRSFTGVFKLRNIDGLWVIASGSIYRDCISEETWFTNSTRPIALRSPHGTFEKFIAIDAGTFNPCVFIEGLDDGDVIWIDREMYFDGRAEMRQKTDSEYADDLIIFANGGDPMNPLHRMDPRYRTGDQRLWPGIIIDPSAASLKTELVKRGFYILDADNTVEEGISMTATMLNLKKLRINKENCPNSVREMQTYAWDEKRAENGKEQPVKKNDHTCDAIRYRVKTRVSPWRLAA